MKLVTVSEMQAIEHEADSQGWTYQQMMEQAGQGLAEIVQAFYGYEEDLSVLGLVGSGNNGGDTLIALEQLAQDGWQARGYLVRPRQPGDPLVARLEQAGGEVASAADDSTDFSQLSSWVAEATVLLDGVLGTGIRLPLKPEVGQVLRFVKDLKHLPDVVAVDCPSGIDLDSGDAAEETIPADLTVCMAAVKTGLLKFPAFELAGHLEVVDIGLPANLPAWEKIQQEAVTEEMVQHILPTRKANSHKGTYGTAGVVAGSLNYTGAALLCAEAAYRIGAGLVQVAVPAPLHTALAGQLPEATWVLLPHEMGVIAEGAVDVLARHLEKVDVLLLGPGFGVEEPTAGFVRRLLESKALRVRANLGFVSAAQAAETDKPVRLPSMVIDADGLKLLARVAGWPQKLPEMSILTPHPGEMAILTGLSLQEVQADQAGNSTQVCPGVGTRGCVKRRGYNYRRAGRPDSGCAGGDFCTGTCRHR
jgi:ADP-dependent NAD(P)H-hydrate dehydratase / NAD(P)H-hydrate epimerase